MNCDLVVLLDTLLFYIYIYKLNKTRNNKKEITKTSGFSEPHPFPE